MDDLLSALPGFHTSSFPSKGKLKALKLIMNSTCFVTLSKILAGHGIYKKG